MVEYILHQIVFGTNWANLFLIIIGVALWWFIDRVLGVRDLILEMTREFVGLFRGQISRSAINGALTIALIVFTVLVFIMFLTEEIPKLVYFLRTGVNEEGQSATLFIVMIFWTGVMALGSLALTRKP